MFTKDLEKLFQRSTIPKIYRESINTFVEEIVDTNQNNIQAILLYGGLVRDAASIEGWSDIDLIIIYKNIMNRYAQSTAKIVNRISNLYSLRIDVEELSLDEITDKTLLKSFLKSEIINALSMRENVSILLYGETIDVKISAEQEKAAALFYINGTMLSFRRYLIENVYRVRSEAAYKTYVPRIVRWTFSIVRASLRLFDIYTQPYEPSILCLEKLFPGIDLSVPKKLVVIRKNINAHTTDWSIFPEIENFLENYTRFIIRSFYEKQCIF